MATGRLDAATRRHFLEGMIVAAAAAAIKSRTTLAQDPSVTLPIISDRKFEGQEVIVTSQSGPVISGPIQNFGPTWEEATGAKIQLVTYPFGQMFEKLRTELGAGVYTSDLVNYQSTWAGDFMGGGFMDTVPDEVLKLAVIDDYYPTFRKAMT
jgi:multiple sugar transport system substrate-binding protein